MTVTVKSTSVHSNSPSENRRKGSCDTEEEETTRVYYCSGDAINFYQQCWGGQGFIHVGIYNDLELFPGGKWKELDDWEVNEYIRKSSFAAVKKLLEMEYLLGPDSYVMDMGSGLGGTARLIAKSFGSEVTCIDLSEVENKQNIEQNHKEGLSHCITVPSMSCSFLDTGEPSEKYDLVISQDSFLHAGNRRKCAVVEAARVLKPGGYLVFSDILQIKNCDSQKMQAVYRRINLSNLGTVEEYVSAEKASGLQFLRFEEYSENLEVHYTLVLRALEEQRARLVNVSEKYIDEAIVGLNVWINAARQKQLCWGYFVFQKPFMHH